MSDAEYQAWLERIDSDLELIRSTPSGREEGLEALDDASRESDHSWGFWTGDDDRYIHIVPYGDTSDVQEYAPEMGDPYDVQDWLGAGRLNAYGNPIPGGADSRPGSNAGPPGSDPGLDDDGVVRYADLNPAALDERPPVASLYHELAHSFDQLSGGTPEGDYTEILYDEDGNEIDRNTAPRAEVNSVGAVRNAGDRAVLVPLGATPALAGAGADVMLSVPFAVQGGGEAPPQVEAVVLGPGQSRPLASESSVALPDGASQVRVCVEVLDADVAPGGGEDGEELRFSAPDGPLPVTQACSAPSALTGAG